jgi:hypothetical protein
MDTPDRPTEPADPDPLDEAPAAMAPSGPSRVQAVVAIVVAVAVTVAFLAGAIGALLRGGGPSVTPQPDPGLLAVVDEAGGLSTIAPGGGPRTTFDAAGGAVQFPAWSPDGTRIAAIRTTGETSGSGPGLRCKRRGHGA